MPGVDRLWLTAWSVCTRFRQVYRAAWMEDRFLVGWPDGALEKGPSLRTRMAPQPSDTVGLHPPFSGLSNPHAWASYASA